jgi:hypothetical protein
MIITGTSVFIRSSRFFAGHHKAWRIVRNRIQKNEYPGTGPPDFSRQGKDAKPYVMRAEIERPCQFKARTPFHNFPISYLPTALDDFSRQALAVVSDRQIVS